jgi:hypothetical protein
MLWQLNLHITIIFDMREIWLPGSQSIQLWCGFITLKWIAVVDFSMVGPSYYMHILKVFLYFVWYQCAHLSGLHFRFIFMSFRVRFWHSLLSIFSFSSVAFEANAEVHKIIHQVLPFWSLLIYHSELFQLRKHFYKNKQARKMLSNRLKKYNLWCMTQLWCVCNEYATLPYIGHWTWTREERR